MPQKVNKKDRMNILLISVHGLIRADQLELGRDADTGGQTKYVVELARTLGELEDVEHVELLTRRVIDSDISKDYAQVYEPISSKAQIVRLDAGPDAYLPKEELWDYLDTFADNALAYIRELGRTPDIIHTHYADAGYVGVRLANLLGIPLVHTGHSLGRVKRRRLLASGLNRGEIETRYNMTRRVEAEEDTLATAELVIASTQNEIEEQYGLYDHYQPELMRVIAPGTDLERFHTPTGTEASKPIAQELRRFLQESDKPMILALSRPDERKNIATLIEAYGESKKLQSMANLVIVAGNRYDIRDMESGARNVLSDILLSIDQYDLYGKVAYPKNHTPDDVPLLYRLAAATHGVFINPALTEPFGLTLIEAAASGLPIVATEDGGPQDIIGHCHNGLLINPLDSEAMSQALLKVLKNRKNWDKLSANGIKGAHQYYSWQAHAKTYLNELRSLLERTEPLKRAPLQRRPMLYHDRAIFSDLDQNLLGNPESLNEFVKVMRDNRKCATFGIATGRSLESALRIMKRFKIPQPDILITSVGTEIYYAPQLTADLDTAPSIDEINSMLHQADLSVNTFLSFGQFLDIVPVRASKGFALRYYADQWGIPLEHILAAGGSGTDEDMLRGNTLAVVVANRHEEELSHLTDVERIYFSKQSYSRGILEAIKHYDFFASCRVPQDNPPEPEK
jgi:sucrose-phosphate synthase